LMPSGIGKRHGVKSFVACEETAFAVCPSFGMVARIDERRLVAETSLGCG
jgi:hypothetical protein